MISVFISSSFMDMQTERDLLQKEVLPELRAYAREFGEEIQFIDLRWGVDLSSVNEEESIRKILEVCFKNIQNSEPYFLGLIGERYGTLIDEDKIPTKDLKRYIGKSLTEAEIEFGVFSGNSSKSLFLFREPLDPKLISADNKEFYFEESRQDKIEKLKNKIKKKVPEERILSYKGNWLNDKLQIGDFSKIVTLALKELIHEDFKIESDLTDEQREINAMYYFVKQKERQFRARKNDLENLKHILKSKQLLIIKGEAGSGKSTLLSALAKDLEKEGEIIPIIADLTSRSRTAEDVLLQQIWALENILNKENFTQVNEETEIKELQDHLSSLISELPNNKPLFIIIDALDQLEQSYFRDSLEFLPRALRKEDRVIITSLDSLELFGNNRYGRTSHKLYTLKNLEEEDIIEVIKSSAAYREIPEETISEIFNKRQKKNPLYLNLLMNKLFLLDAPHFKEIANYGQDNKDHTAEYLKKIIEESPNDLDKLTVDLINDAGEYFGKKLSEEVFGILSTSRRGFTVNTLEKIIGDNFTLLNFELLSKYLDTLLIQHEDSHIDFSHRIVRKGLKSYFKDSEKENYIKVFDYLKSLDNLDPLKLREFLYYCIKIENFDEVKSYLNWLIEKDNYEALGIVLNEIRDLSLDNEKWILKFIHSLTEKDILIINFINSELENQFIRSNENLQLLFRIYKTIQKKIESLINNKNASGFYLILSHIFNSLGIIQKNLGELEAAKKSFVRTIELEENLVDLLETPESRADLANNLNNLGILQSDLGELEEAKQSFLKAIEINKGLVDLFEIPKLRTDFASTLNNLGNLQSNLGELEEAKQSFLKAIEIDKGLVDLLGTPESRANLASTLFNLGSLQQDLGELKEAKQSFLKAIEISKDLVDLLGTPESKERLAKILSSLGILQQDSGELEEAKLSYIKAIKISEDLVDLLGTLESKSDLAFSLNNLGFLQQDLGELEEAKLSYIKAIEFREDLVDLLRTPESKISIASTLNSLGTLQQDLGELEEAKLSYIKAIRISEDSVDLLRSQESRAILIDSLNSLGILQNDLGELEEAKQSYTKVTQIREELFNSLGTLETREDFIESLINLSLIQNNLDETKKAKKNFSKAIKIIEESEELLKILEYQEILAFLFDNLGITQMTIKQLKEAKQSFMRAIEIKKELVKFQKTQKDKQSLANSFNILGSIQNNLGELKEAKQSFMKAIEISEELVKFQNSQDDKQSLANSLSILGSIQNNLGELKEAKQSYLKAIEIKEELVKLLGTQSAKVNLVNTYSKITKLLHKTGHHIQAIKYYIKSIRYYIL